MCFGMLENELTIDFLKGTTGYRQRHSHAGNELLAKAVGIKGRYKPTVVDATAGLGRDAFILACLGCAVTMLERSKDIAKLLEDALQRLEADKSFQKKIILSLVNIDAKQYFCALKAENCPDVIYLDPMFPHRKKSALVKKEIRLLREMVGDDEDAADLFAIALNSARKRVVVKRPRLAPSFDKLKPNFVLTAKAHRFDVYVTKADN